MFKWASKTSNLNIYSTWSVTRVLDAVTTLRKFGVKIVFDNFCWIKRRIKLCPSFTWKMQLLKNGNVWLIHGWQMRTLFPASSLSRRGETALLAGNARSLWPLEAVALSLLILYLFKRRSFLEKFSERGVNITFIGPLNCLPKKYK